MEIDRYKPSEIEDKWRKVWEKEKTFQVDLKRAKKPFYNLMMFPYPSGEGLHVGHVYAFGGSDTYGKLKRLEGFDVFEPMGFDSFGIHSENYAIKENIHPKKLIEETTTYFREEQLKRLGALFDWDHQVITSEADYYRWTQWVFTQLFKAGLAVRKEAPVDWCPSCKTVLADEQVISGRCERCSTEVVQKELEQWFFKITSYAERLLKNLDWIDWSETTKQMQRNWIGRSEGAIIKFPVARDQRPGKTKSGNWSLEAGDCIEVFTTRPDTIYGATFMVLAPEHQLALKVATAKNYEAVANYIEESAKVTELERTSAKTGVFTGAFCVNPFTEKEIPIWVADYVLGSYGTGAIMAVPAHDGRDYDFAKEHKLPIVEVISGGDIQKEAYVGEGKLVNSGQFSSLDAKQAIQKISKYIEDNKIGRRAVNYHLRDWLISRQRYWGPPIPMIYCGACAKEGRSWFTTDEAKKCQEAKKEKTLNTKYKIQDTTAMRGWYPVPEKDLPVTLPYLVDYQPKGAGASPLANLPDFVNVKCPGCGKTARRETDVSDTFLDSSWYFLRYPSVGLPTSGQVPFDPELTKKWLPVDMYIGGNEHAVLHLLYTRFITMVLSDLGFLHFEEPFKKFRAHGLIIHGGAKMSKSRGNVINPNEYIEAYGADTLRTYLLFIGPYDQGGDFSDRAIAGVYRFLKRVWQTTLEISENPAKNANILVARQINKLIKKVGEDVEDLKFNTAIAALMEFANFAAKNKNQIDIDSIRKYVIVLSIFAPFTAEELWFGLGGKESVHKQSWPVVEERTLKEEKVTIPVQVDGKLRDTLEIHLPTGGAGNSKIDRSVTLTKVGGTLAIRDHFVDYKDQNEVEKLALDLPKVKKHLESKKVKKTIYVPGKILNIVTEK